MEKKNQKHTSKTKRDLKNSSTGEKAEAGNRAKWEVYEEFDLLQAFEDLRKDPKAATDKDITKAAWSQLTTKLNTKHKRTLVKAQYKSKVSRLMQDYDIYMEMKGKSGVGVCPETGKLTFPDDVWERLERSKPKKVMDKIKRFRKYGFEHECACYFAAGDVRPTGSEADRVEDLAKQIGSSGSAAEDDCTGISYDNAPAEEATSDNDSNSIAEVVKQKATKLPPSHERRAINVKRIRDGASKSRRDAQQHRKEIKLVEKKQLQAFLATANKYFEFKLHQEMAPIVSSPPMASITSMLSRGSEDAEADSDGLDDEIIIAEV